MDSGSLRPRSCRRATRESGRVACDERRTIHRPCSAAAAEILSRERFGNIIRAFEVYPRQVYEADSGNIWPRLASVMSKDFSALQDDARAQVDFFVRQLQPKPD